MNNNTIKLSDLVGAQNVKKPPFKRYDTIFILGAGFSKPAGFPLTTEIGRKLRENKQYNWGKFNDQQRGIFYNLLDEFKIGNSASEDYNFEEALTHLYQKMRFDDLNRELVEAGLAKPMMV